MFKIIIIMANLLVVNLGNAPSPSLAMKVANLEDLVVITPLKSEETLIDSAIVALQAIDVECSEYVTVHDSISEPTGMNLSNSSVDELVTANSKGGPLDDLGTATAFADVTALGDLVFARGFSVDSGNIRGWFIIRKLDVSNFKLEVAILDVLNQVDRIDVDMIDLVGNAPLPESLAFEVGGLGMVVSGLSKTGTSNVQTFEDPGSIVGENVDVTLSFFTSAPGLIGSVNFETTVQDI